MDMHKCHSEDCEEMVCLHQDLCFQCLDEYCCRGRDFNDECLRRAWLPFTNCFRCVLEGKVPFEVFFNFSERDDYYQGYVHLTTQMIELGKADEKENKVVHIETLSQELQTNWIIKKYYEGVNSIRRLKDITPTVYPEDTIESLILNFTEKTFVVSHKGKKYSIEISPLFTE